MSNQRIVIRPGRHVGWWLDGHGNSGRRFMIHWWPTKGLASMVARFWVASARRAGRGEVTVEVRDAGT